MDEGLGQYEYDGEQRRKAAEEEWARWRGAQPGAPGAPGSLDASGAGAPPPAPPPVPPPLPFDTMAYPGIAQAPTHTLDIGLQAGVRGLQAGMQRAAA